MLRAARPCPSLADRVIGHVEEIEFPQLPRPYETSYTYGFEAM